MTENSIWHSRDEIRKCLWNNVSVPLSLHPKSDFRRIEKEMYDKFSESFVKILEDNNLLSLEQQLQDIKFEFKLLQQENKSQAKEIEELKRENATLRESDNPCTHHYMRLLSEIQAKDERIKELVETLYKARIAMCRLSEPNAINNLELQSDLTVEHEVICQALAKAKEVRDE